MKKKIFIISVVLVGFIVAIAGNSWAQREKGGDRRANRGDQIQKWNGSKDRDMDRSRIRDRAPSHNPRPQLNRPGSRLKSKFDKGVPHRPAYRFKPKFHKRMPNRAPYRYAPKFRPWRNHPVYRHHPGRPFQSVVKEINHYYSSAESYAAPEDEFSASATITESGFAFSVGVKETN